VHNGIARTARLGDQVHFDHGIVPGTSDFAVKHALCRGFSGNGFAVDDLGSSRIDTDMIIPLQPTQHNLEVQFPHAADDCLAGIGILTETKGGVFFGKFGEGIKQLFLVGPSAGFDCDRHDGLIGVDRFKKDGTLGGTERISC